MIKVVFLLLTTTALMVGCKQKTQNQTASMETQAVDPSQLTSINFTEANHDFGKVTDGEIVSYTYKFQNTGEKPLIISNATNMFTSPNVQRFNSFIEIKLRPSIPNFETPER